MKTFPNLLIYTQPSTHDSSQVCKYILSSIPPHPESASYYSTQYASWFPSMKIRFPLFHYRLVCEPRQGPQSMEVSHVVSISTA